MNERPSHIERYQAMTPRERNAEMKQIFELLPDFDATFAFQQDMNSREKDAAYERIEKLIERRVNSDFKKDLSLRLKSLLSFSPTTESFKVYILDTFDNEFECGITRRPDKVEDKVFPSGIEFYSRLFQWDSSENGGIFGLNAEEIERNVYENLVWFHLSSMQMAEKMGLTQEDIEEMKKDAKNKGQFFEIAKQFEDDEELPKLRAKIKANNNLKKVLGEDQKRKELIEQWKIEFKNLYGEEP